ncbi:hypothetical protein RJ55_08346 [Drechmeria coniospora]|nr:hypothetical protein RJ55_08346 [Drechmeria coniospora]
MRPFSSALLVAFALVLGLERGNLPHAAAGDVGDQAPGSDPVPPSSPPPSYEEAIEVSGSTPTTKSGHRHTTENPLRALEIHPIYRWLKDRDAPTNCFFVVVARLLRTTVAEIIRRSGLDLPPNGRGNGITLDDVFAAFERLGIRLRILSFRGPVEPSAPGPIQHLIYCRRTVRGRRWRRLPPREIGVVYVRPTESIHAVVVRNAGRAGTLYVDYQADPAGRDAWPDVRQSNICFYFYVDEEASSANFAVAHRWRTVEASAQEAAAEAAQPNSDDASALPNSNDENVGFVEDITDALNVPFEDPTENTETVHPDQQAQPPPEEVATTNTPNTGDGPQDTMETNAESMGDATAVEDIAMPNTSNTGGDVQDTVDNTPVPLQQTPTEQEAEAAASSIPTPTAGVDLQTLNPSMVARIFAGLLNRDMCIRYLVLVANARERFPEKPHFHGKRAEEVKDTSCAELKYEVERSQACSQITSLEIGIFLSPDRGSGTYDYILATIGNETVELGFNTNGGYDAWKQVDLKSAFSSDTIDIRRVQSLELVDKGRTWTISLFRNDEWKVKGKL